MTGISLLLYHYPSLDTFVVRVSLILARMHIVSIASDLENFKPFFGCTFEISSSENIAIPMVLEDVLTNLLFSLILHPPHPPPLLL